MLTNYGVAQPGQNAKLTSTDYVPPPRASMDILGVCFSLLLPWLLFAYMDYVLSFGPHYRNPYLCNSVIAIFLVLILGLGCLASTSSKRHSAGMGKPPTWYKFLFASCLIAWISAWLAGSANYNYNSVPFYDVENLQIYTSVDPAVMGGKQLLDAGRMVFTPDSKLDLRKTMAFRNTDIFCVAPVVSGTEPMGTYDFWAVGTNCCSGHDADFHCGEYNNTRASSGLRLMREDQIPFYTLAVKQAQSAYQIEVRQPIFLTWMEDPMGEINKYQDASFRYFLLSVFLFFSWQFFITVLAIFSYAKKP